MDNKKFIFVSEDRFDEIVSSELSRFVEKSREVDMDASVSLMCSMLIATVIAKIRSRLVKGETEND